MKLIYSFQNNGATMVARGANSNSAEGLCFGYSVVWCVKMQKYKGQNQLLTRPEMHEAFPLQQRVEMLEENSDWSSAVPDMVKRRGHGCTAVQKRHYTVVPRQLALDDAWYIIDIGDHWVAAGHSGSTYAFFDSNEGMTVFRDADEFRTGVITRLNNYKNDPDPDNGWEDTHNIYRITQ